VVDWRKSTYSGGNGGDCVEVGQDDLILVRDTADRGGCTLPVPAPSWSAFISSVR
jgi:hypothetical protein